MEKQKPLVLLVDDDCDFLNALELSVQELGFRTITAVDGEDGWKKYINHLPMLVISDIYMPKKNGLVLLGQIKEHNFSQVVILITGFAHYRQMLSTMRFPPDGFIQKPFSLDKLYETIKNCFPSE